MRKIFLCSKTQQRSAQAQLQIANSIIPKFMIEIKSKKSNVLLFKKYI